MHNCIISEPIQNTLRIKDISFQGYKKIRNRNICVTISSWKMCWQCLGWLDSKPGVKKFWPIRTKATAAHFTANSAQCWVNHSVSNDKGKGEVNANYNAIHLPSLTRKNKTKNDSRLLKNSKGNRHGQWNFCQGKEADITLFFQVTKARKIRKNLRSNLVDDCPKLSNEPNETQLANKNGLKSTNHKPYNLLNLFKWRSVS